MHFLFHPGNLAAVQDLDECIGSGELWCVRRGKRSQGLKGWMARPEVILPDMDEAKVALVGHHLLVTSAVRDVWKEDSPVYVHPGRCTRQRGLARLRERFRLM